MSDTRARIDRALDKIAAAFGDLTEAVQTADDREWANNYLAARMESAGFTQSTEEIQHALMVDTPQERQQTWSDCRPSINLDWIAMTVQLATNYRTVIAQTGGGTATLYVYADPGDVPGDRALAVAGPGYFTDPSWTTARANYDGFCIGLDDDEDHFWYPRDEHADYDDDALAVMIAEYAEAVHDNILSKWINVEPEAKPSWA